MVSVSFNDLELLLEVVLRRHYDPRHLLLFVPLNVRIRMKIMEQKEETYRLVVITAMVRLQVSDDPLMDSKHFLSCLVMLETMGNNNNNRKIHHQQSL